MTRKILFLLIVLSLGARLPAQESKAPVTATFLLSPGEWTQEFERLAAHLGDEIRKRGRNVVSTEIEAPNVIAITYESATQGPPSVRELLPILRDPRLGAWPGLQLLGLQGGTEPLTLTLRGRLVFEVTRPTNTAWDDEMIARKVFEKAYETRNGVAPALDVLEAFQFVDVKTESLGGERLKVEGEFLYRHPRFTATELDRILTLFLDRPRIEFRRVVAATGAVEAALRSLDPDLSLTELNGRPEFVDAVAQVVSRFEPSPKSFRLRSRLAVVRANDPLFGTEDFASIGRTTDSQGRAALTWELEKGAAARYETFTAENRGAHLAYCVAGEVWSEIVVGSRLPGEGAIYGDFSEAKVEKVVRTFAPMDPPSTWTLIEVTAK